jgi:hypothetical protein
MSRHTNRRVVVWTLLLAGLFAVQPSAARVFRRWSGAAHSHRAMETMGGRAAYRAEVAVNNGSGQLTVYAFPNDLATVIRDLRRTFEFSSLTYSGGGLGLATLEKGGETLRLVAIRLPDHGQTLIFMLEMAAAELADARRPPAAHKLAGVPEYPGSAPLFYAADREGGLGMAISRVAAAPRQTQTHYRAILERHGWQALYPPAGRESAVPASAMALYEKGREQCVVHVDPDPDNPANTRLTLLHKSPGKTP